jgi:hypothetical protein
MSPFPDSGRNGYLGGKGSFRLVRDISSPEFSAHFHLPAMAAFTTFLPSEKGKYGLDLVSNLSSTVIASG